MKTRCRCGKIAWPSEQEALDILVRLKIKFALRGRAKRKETRVYHCDMAPGWWHLTSLPEWDDPTTRADVESAELEDRSKGVDELLQFAERQVEEINCLKDVIIALGKRRDSLAKERDGAWAAVCELGLAVQRHKSRTAQPTGLDRNLWQEYDSLMVPVPSGHMYVSTAVKTKHSGDIPEPTPTASRVIAPYGIPRMAAAAIAAFPTDTVARETVRALLPVGLSTQNGSSKGKGNEVSRRFGVALKQFEERSWIVRRDEWVDILAHETLSTYSTHGITQDPRQALDVERAIKFVEELPPGEQRERELSALHDLQRALLL